MRVEQTANQTKAKRLSAKVHFDCISLMRSNETTPEQLAAAAQKLRESVRVGQ